MVLATTSVAQTLERGEYFVDLDPGFGNGTSITFAPATEVALQLPIPVSGLSTGSHVLGFRMKDADGNWGLTNRRLFMVSSMAPGGDIVRFEHFLDADPGFGNGTQVVAAAAPEVTNLLFDVLTDGLAPGAHTLFVRALSSTGAWSITNAKVFDVVVGIHELIDLGIVAGPNPMQDALFLQRTSAAGTIDLDLMDAQGRRLASTQWIGDRIMLDTGVLAAGSDLLLLRAEGRSPVVVKIAKQ